MSTKRGYLTVGIGAALVYAGVFRMLANLGTVQPVLLWAVVALAGIFVAIRGGVRVLKTDETTRADPNKALRKTDSRFGR